MRLISVALLAMILTLASACARTTESTHQQQTVSAAPSLVGQLLLPSGRGSRGVEIVAQIVDAGGDPNTVWVRFDEQGHFARTVEGRVTSVTITAGPALHRIDQLHLPKTDQVGQIDLGAIDLRERLHEHRLGLRAAPNAQGGDVRIGLWIGPPPRGPQGEPVSLGSAQFPAVELGTEVDWLLPPESHSIYFLVERPADSRRGREWRSGPQQLFGPYTAAEFPSELVVK